MRLFIAVDLEPEKDFFMSISGKLDRSLFKGSLAKSFHLTLKFLGDVSDDKADELKKRLGQVEFEGFFIEFDRLGSFPDERNIRVIWAGLSDDSKIVRLQRCVETALAGMFPAEKNFHPHLTLARVRFARSKEGLLKNISEIRFEKKTFEVNGFKLIKSTLTIEGPIYETLLEIRAES